MGAMLPQLLLLALKVPKDLKLLELGLIQKKKLDRCGLTRVV